MLIGSFQGELSESCPLQGIGRYITKFSEIPFVYLEIVGMRYDFNTKQPYFDFRFLRKSTKKSQTLEDELPEASKGMFSVIESEKLYGIFQKIGEEPPNEWKALMGEGPSPIDWKDYIGKHLLEMEGRALSNDDFEDRIADLLTALGFEVLQKGHKLRGEYPDGIFSYEDYAVVYDCKNRLDFASSAADKRAIEKYLSDERKARREEHIYPAFIAKSFRKRISGDIFNLTVESLLYLLYKRLLLGPKFFINPIKKILANKIPLNIEGIDKEWIL